ncbi:hypothetical protein [Stutzerimonas nitrititolerans]|uniref:hypothetical protein n=1 Tax=Stutzerimonas nitrititolerans TaxID=2482751 RepID=UPI00289DDB49|nr:hypothetical protein [Stutzerimonas nitrititolerans]
MRCWARAQWMVLALLAGCAGDGYRGGDPSPILTQSAACQAYSQAWVDHFRASVASLDGRRGEAAHADLVLARAQLQQMQMDDGCYKPYCLIQPRAEGRLDAYCGYKVPDPTGAELYRWIPWTNLN